MATRRDMLQAGLRKPGAGETPAGTRVSRRLRRDAMPAGTRDSRRLRGDGLSKVVGLGGSGTGCRRVCARAVGIRTLRVVLALPAGLTLLTAGCRLADVVMTSLSDDLEITLQLPTRSELPSPLERWEPLETSAYVQVRLPTGVSISETSPRSSGMRPAVRTVTGKLGEKLAVRVPKERWTFFTARVCVAPTAGGSGMDAFCTELYGAVWRSDGGAGGELVRFDARDGAAVAVLRRVQRAGLDPEGFNVRRFMEEYRAVAGDRGWALDREALVSALEGGGFRVTALRLREFFPVSVVVPPGRWLPDRPGIHMIPQSAASEYGEGYRISAGLTREEQDRRAGQGARASSGLQDYVLPSGIYSFFESDTGAVYRVRVSSTGEVLAGRFR